MDFENREFGPVETVELTSLVDWTASDHDRMKYYSGTATYKTSFRLDQIPEEGDLFLNLGNVGVMARVRLNGSDLGVTWMAPYRLTATEALQVGDNELEIEVVNLWRNRMVGDLELPESQRFTTITVNDAVKGEELTASGLMGPVSIELKK